MKNFIHHKTFGLKWVAILPGILFLLMKQEVQGQVISNNGAYVSISAGTVVSLDTINNDNATTLANEGTITISTINNAGTTQGNGTYNIAGNFINTGTFNSGTGTVNYNGLNAQFITLENYYNLTVTGARAITLDSSGTIGIANTFEPGANTYTITGTKINFNGTGAQAIPAFTFIHVLFSGGNTKTAVGNINVLSSLTLGENTVLNLGSNNITLKSSATNIARIATVPPSASITYGSGRFTVERYIPGRRKYRLLTSSVTTNPAAVLSVGQEASSIWGNWQNQGNNGLASRGTIITGGTSDDGFDQNTTTPSMYIYDEVNRKFVGFSSANGKNTKKTPLKAGVAYFFFVYGDRTNTIITMNPNATVLAATGTVLTGEQVYNTSSPNPLTGVTGRYTMLGNPYASSIDWASLLKTNVENTFWGWDPNLKSTGGYVTVNTSGSITLIAPFSGTVGLDQYIQPGQGFFVRTSAASPELRIRETDKVDNFNPLAFRNASTNDIPLIAVNLFYDEGSKKVLADGILAAFNSSYSNSIGKEDATKLHGIGEEIAFLNGTELLSIEARKLPESKDTLYLNISKLTKAQYTLQVFAHKMENSNVGAYLEDKYLKTVQSISLSDTNWIKFDVSSTIPASFSADRFNIVFSDLKDLPGTVILLKATPKDQQVLIDWSVSSEAGVQKYAVQRSSDGVNFITIAEVLAKGSSNMEAYQYLDAYPASGKNYYRIKTLSQSGINLLSQVVSVFMGDINPSIIVFPNPVTNYQINIKLKSVPVGTYSFLIFDIQGRILQSQQIEHKTGIFYYPVLLKNKLSSGMYYLRVKNNKTSYVTSFFVKE